MSDRGRQLVRLMVIGGALAGAAFMAPPALATHVECGDTVAQSTTLDSDLVDCPGTGIRVVGQNVTLDLGGHTVDGTGSAWGIQASACPPGEVCEPPDSFTLRNGHVREFRVGVEAERQGTIRKGVRALAAVYQATTPWCSIIVRKAFGVAGAGHSNQTRSSPRYAWPSGEWGSLPIEGGVEAAYKRQLQEAEDPDKLREELEERLASFRDPMLTAEAFGVEEIIDPRDTRPLLVEFARLAHHVVEAEPRGPKARGVRP